MGKTYFESKEAKCPFYLHERQQEICCESIVPNAVAHIAFPRNEAKIEHQERYCNTMNYEDCKRYQALIKRYAGLEMALGVALLVADDIFGLDDEMVERFTKGYSKAVNKYSDRENFLREVKCELAGRGMRWKNIMKVFDENTEQQKVQR